VLLTFNRVKLVESMFLPFSVIYVSHCRADSHVVSQLHMSKGWNDKVLLINDERVQRNTGILAA
jgi:hypothetical protein